MAKRYWLMKSEPDVYSLSDLERDGETGWEGVRNYQARNFMRDDMRVGDGVLFYHSNTKPPGIVGLARVSKKAYPDPSQFNPMSDYHDPKATEDAPRWLMVAVEFVERFAETLALQDLKKDAKLDGMALLQRGQRLSVQPVEAGHWKHILKLAGSSAKL